MTIFHFAVTLLKAFELGLALFQSLEEATLSQLLSHGPIPLALPMTGLQHFIRPSLMEDVKESLGCWMRGWILFSPTVKYIKLT